MSNQPFVGGHDSLKATSRHHDQDYSRLPTGSMLPSAPLEYPAAQNYNTIVQSQPGPIAAVGNANLLNSSPVKKSLVEAYLLWLVVGLFGGHHFYLKRPYFGLIYIFSFGLFGCGWFIDLFRMPYLVSEANKAAAENEHIDKKTISDAYTLWFPFGLKGLHHFYLGNTWQGIVYFFTLGIFGIGWLVDLVRMPWLVKEANERGVDKRKKGVCLTYMLSLPPLGLHGIYHFYLNRPFFGLVYMCTYDLCGIGWIVDLFRIPVLVKRANKEMEEGPDNTKYLDDAYILWFPFGLLGLHHFYLNRPIWGILYFLTLGLAGIGWLVDGFRMPCLVKDCNARIKLMPDRVLINRRLASRGYVIAAPSGISATPDTGYRNPGYSSIQGSNTQQQPQYDPSYRTPRTDPTYQLPQAVPQVPAYMEPPPPYTESSAIPSANWRDKTE